MQMSRTKRIVTYGICLFIVLAVVICASSKYRRWSEERNRRECAQDMRFVFAAIISAALWDGVSLGERIAPEQFVGDIVHWKGELPECPSGGRYTIPPVGGVPTCSYHGNLLKETGELEGPIRPKLLWIYEDAVEKGIITNIPRDAFEFFSEGYNDSGEGIGVQRASPPET